MNKLLGLLEQILKAAAIFAALGYMSLRSYLNYLGISSMVSLGVERYAAEAYLLVLSVLLTLATLLPFALLLLPLYGLGMVLQRLPGTAKWLRQVPAMLKRCLSNPLVACLVLLTLALLVLWLLGTVAAPRDVIVGRLLPSKLGDRQTWRFDLALVVAVLGLALNPIIRQALEQAPDTLQKLRATSLWKLALLFFGLLLVALPMVYGQAVHPALFPVARADFKAEMGRAPICGLLALASEDSVSLWRADGGFGRVVTLRREDLAGLQLGPLLDILSVARKAVAGRPEDAGHPSCTPLFPSS